MADGIIYCPICECSIVASNKEEVESGEHDSYIYVHKEIPHDDNDLEALNYPVQ